MEQVLHLISSFFTSCNLLVSFTTFVHEAGLGDKRVIFSELFPADFSSYSSDIGCNTLLLDIVAGPDLVKQRRRLASSIKELAVTVALEVDLLPWLKDGRVRCQWRCFTHYCF